MTIDLWREASTAGVLVALLAGAALADPWRQGEPRGLGATRQPTLPARERHEPGAAFGSPVGSFRPGIAESTLPRSAGAPRSPGVTRAVESRGEPIVLRLGFQRMVQVQFGADIQQVITAFRGLQSHPGCVEESRPSRREKHDRHRVLICDRDSQWTDGFRRIVQGAGVRIVLTPSRRRMPTATRSASCARSERSVSTA
jgi:hypothetical protein